MPLSTTHVPQMVPYYKPHLPPESYLAAFDFPPQSRWPYSRGQQSDTPPGHLLYRYQPLDPCGQIIHKIFVIQFKCKKKTNKV